MEITQPTKLMMTQIITILLVFCIVFSGYVSAQTSSTSPPATQWQKSYGSGETAQVSNLIQTSDGGYAFLDCGNLYQFTFTPSTLFKLDSSGNEQWNKTINYFKAYSTGSAIIQTSDGGYEIAGEWNSVTPTIIKLNSKGDIQWYENTSTVLNLATASSNIQTSDGGFAYFEAGNYFLNPPINYPPFSLPSLVKTDSNNNTQWIENLTYSGPGSYGNGTITFPFEISSIIETSDGALACLGIADPYEHPQGLWGYIYLLKTAPILPLPSQSPLPTPLPSPTPAPTMITVNEQIVIIAVIAVVVASSIVLLIYRTHLKNANLGK
jgi:hypothetical protein